MILSLSIQNQYKNLYREDDFGTMGSIANKAKYSAA
jgi:hypothetical protein